MKIENIDSINNIHVNNNSGIKKQVLRHEATDKVSISTAQEIKEALKLDNPPYFPLGDTQAIFKK
jgi:hypothetical protein